MFRTRLQRRAWRGRRRESGRRSNSEKGPDRALEICELLNNNYEKIKKPSDSEHAYIKNIQIQNMHILTNTARVCTHRIH